MPLGTLREALQFGHHNSEGLVSDERLISALRDVRLEDLVANGQGGGRDLGGMGLDTVGHNWSDVLSLGEQQRIAFARVLIRPSRYIIHTSYRAVQSFIGI